MKNLPPKKERTVKKPWGSYVILEKHPGFWLKKLFINKGELLSLQSHGKRSEIWVVLKGKVAVQKGEKRFVLSVGEFLKIEAKEKHRIKGLSQACILEVAFGATKERDIIRYEDKYNRH